MRRFRAGDEQAFVVLHDRHRPRVLREVGAMVAGRGVDDEAITQEVFLRAHRGLRRTDAEMHLRPWLRSIARNRCLDALRTPRIDVLDSDLVERMSAHEAADPGELVVRREDLQRVIGGVRALPESQRVALVAQEIEGRSQPEIARDLGVSVGAVKSLIVRPAERWPPCGC